MLIILDAAEWSKSNWGVDLVITSTKSTYVEDLALGRKSASHREGRAIDIRTKDLDIFFVEQLVFYINNNPRFKKYHYMSSNGVERLAYYHNNGNGDHLHVAIHSKFK